MRDMPSKVKSRGTLGSQSVKTREKDKDVHSMNSRLETQEEHEVILNEDLKPLGKKATREIRAKKATLVS